MPTIHMTADQARGTIYSYTAGQGKSAPRREETSDLPYEVKEALRTLPSSESQQYINEWHTQNSRNH